MFVTLLNPGTSPTAELHLWWAGIQDFPTPENGMLPGLGGAAALFAAGTFFGGWLNFPPDEDDDSPEEKERKKRARRRLLAASAGHLGVAVVILAAGFFDATRILPD
jgi:hypothetical protein